MNQKSLCLKPANINVKWWNVTNYMGRKNMVRIYMVRRHKWLKIINVKTINSISCTIKNSYHHSIAGTSFLEPEWCILAPYLHFLMSDPSEFLESTILTPSWSRCSEWSVQLIEVIRERKRTVRVRMRLNIVQKACSQYVSLRIACWTYLRRVQNSDAFGPARLFS